MKLCLLAAGFAKRMYPLTRDRAKPLLEVGGEAMLTRLLGQACAAAEFSEIGVVAAGRFAEEFAQWNSELSQRIRLIDNGAADDSQARGAVADLALLLEQGFDRSAQDGYLVMAGDNLLSFDLAEAHRLFVQDPAHPVLLVRSVPEPIPPRKYSEVQVDWDQQQVLSFREKPDDPEFPWSAIGVYFLPPDLPELLEAYLEAGGEADAPGHFLVWLSKVRSCRAWPVPDGSWLDVGSLEGLEQARARFAAKESPRA